MGAYIAGAVIYVVIRFVSGDHDAAAFFGLMMALWLHVESIEYELRMRRNE
ncbi:hypothetical protein HIU98_15665 [Enterococcus casseliflavus]|nr:hypothetical protein [Enterococcus casseliflavus]